MNQYEVEPTCGSTSTPPSRILPQHSPRSILTAAVITAVSLTASSTSALPHNTAGLSGGYLTSPPSRNFVAYTSNNLLPNAARPLSSLPQLESNPHLLVSSHSYAGGTCGSGYDAPLSRMQTRLPLDVQSSYTAGGEIEVTINTFGIDEGGHYEFHLCPLTYPEVPTWDCFVKYPLEFVEDVYYGGVRDERYPERVYLPLSGAFDNNSFEAVRDDKMNPGWNGEMMEFKYVLKLPSDEALVSRLESGGDAVDGDVVTSNSQGVSQEGDAVSSFGDLVANSQGLGENDQEITEDSSFATQFIEGSSSSSNLGPGKNRFLLHKRRRLQTTGLLEKENHTKITNITNPLNSTLLLSSEGKQQWYATQVDSGYTVSSVATVPISSIVTDGNGTTTIFTLDGVTVLTGGAAIPASMTTTWGDAAIYGEGIDLAVLDRPPPPPATTEAPEVAVESESSETSTTTTSTSNMLNPAVNDVKPSTQDKNKYVLLRWHYQTSSNCYPKGYDTYSWPSEWGDWTEPSLGQCQDDSNQKNYWNCAEIKILPPQEGKEDMTTNSESKLPPPPPPPPPQENQAPQAMPDMILVGMNELAHLNVLANDTDPNGDELHLMEVTEAQHGYVALLAGKTELIYAPDHDFEGLDTFEYTVCDAYGQCDIAKIDVLVGSNSDLVFAKDDRVVTTGTNPVIVDVTANDVLQRDGQPVVQSIDPLIVAEASGTRRGTCKITSSNKIRYQASEAFLASQAGPGLDKCKYTVCLGEKSKVCDEGWLTIKILPAEDQEDTALAQISTPESLHNDDGGDMHVLTSNIGSTGSGDILAIDDNAVTDSHDEPFTINVLKNDEYEGTPYLTDVTQAASGECSLTDDNQVLYTPTPGFTGWDRCQYIACVEDDVCDEGQIKIQVIILPQDTSFSSNIVTTTDKGTVETARPLVIDVIANDVKVGSSQPLLVTDVSSALHGGCVVTDDNKVEYISEKGFTGWDRCQYTVCAGKTCNVGQIGVKVTPEGSNPVADVSPGALQPNSEELTDAVDLSVIAKSDAVMVEAGKTVYLDVLANDIKPDGEWTIKSVTEPTAGHAQIVFGRVEYTPVDHFVGLDSFEYTVCDEHENCDSASIVVTVASSVPSGHQDNSLGGVTIKNAADAVVNHGEEISSPQVFAEDDEATVISSNIVLVDAAANDISSGGQSLSISSVSKATHGTCVVSPDNKIEYTAPEEFVGFDRCTYLVCADGECDQGRIEFTVLAPATETIVPPSGENASPVDGITIATLEGAENTPTSDEDVQSSFGGITVMSEPVKIVTDSNRVYADNDSVITAQNVAILVDVTANDSVEEIDDLAITHVGGSKHGNCVIEGIQVRYMPSENFIGHDRCGYVVCEESICDEGIIRIQVIADESALKHVKHDKASSASLSSSVGTTKSSPVKLCWQAALYDDVRRLRGNSFKSNHKLVGKNRHLEANAQSSCVGPSLVTRVINPTQTITYTSTYHAKDNGSNTRSVDMHSKIRSASASQDQGPYIETRISLSATEDATVMPGFPDLNFGSSQSMLVSSESSTSGRRDAFLKFDTSSVDKSVCSDGIVDAKVTIYSLQSSAQGGTFLTIPNSVEWKEEDLTWSNAPSSNGIVLESLGRVNGRTYYDVDVSSAVKLGLPLSLHILAGEQSEVSAQYATRDHTDSSLHPMLLISCISNEELELDQ